MLLTMDVTGTIDVSDPMAVCAEVKSIFSRRYPHHDFSVFDILYRDFSALYRGELHGYVACDTGYHDMQHVLDVSLAMARLIDGYEINHSNGDTALGVKPAVLGMVVAVFHDSGYIRRSNDEQFHRGAEYTKNHVSRGAQFMAEHLPTMNLASFVPLASKLIQFTGYEMDLSDIVLDNERHRVLGALLGTADVIAQMADYAYLEKCRDRLYPEFELGGVTRQQQDDGSERVIYESAEDLLIKTPEFIKNTITNRLDGHFGSLYRNIESHFGGRNYYMEALERNTHLLESLLAKNDPSLLSQSLLRLER